MRILFAAPDRDLLECYKKILEADFGETVTAFDGTHVLALAAAECFDIAILDRDVPRIDHKILISRMQENRIPVIALINGPVNTRLLSEERPANAYLSYPFTSEDITKAINDVIGKASSAERLSFCGIEIVISDFSITGGPRLTAGEIDVLQSLLRGSPVTSNNGACVSSLNAKFAEIGSKARIKYRSEKGFELVSLNE